MTILSILAVVLAACAGIFVSDPWLAVEILPPPLGMFVFGAITGQMPPLFDLSAIRNETRLNMIVKPGDVFVASCFKCGTTWTMNIIHQLRAWHNETLAETFEDITDVVPWPIKRPAPRTGFQEIYSLLQERNEWWNHESYPFRAFKVQIMPEGEALDDKHKFDMQVRKDLRYIVVVRDPAEQIESGLHHFRNLEPKLYQFGMPEMSVWEMKQMLAMHGSAVYLQAWRDYVADPNVFLVNYKDLKRDTEVWLRRLAKFLDLEIPEDVWPTIIRRVGIKWMRDNQSKFQYRLDDNLKKEKKVVEFVRGHNKTHFLTRDEAIAYRDKLADDVDEDVFEYLIKGGDELREKLIVAAAAAAKTRSP